MKREDVRVGMRVRITRAVYPDCDTVIGKVVTVAKTADDTCLISEEDVEGSTGKAWRYDQVEPVEPSTDIKVRPVVKFEVGKRYRFKYDTRHGARTCFNPDGHMDFLLLRLPETVSMISDDGGVIFDGRPDWGGCGWTLAEKDFEEVYEDECHCDPTDWSTPCPKCMKELIEEEMTMNIEEIKPKNLKEAQKQFEAERTNAEVEFAKNKLRVATDAVDELDRQIKSLEEQKKPHLEVLAKFK